MNDAEALYRDYWVGESEARERRAYYERLYDRVRPKIALEDGWKVLDVAGGNGQLLRYLGITKADILDLSRSGLEEARRAGFNPVFGDVESRFPVEQDSYDAVLCFEVLEHLRRPTKTLAEIHNVLKTGGVFYVGQPNMRADGVYHVRRYYPRELAVDLEKTGFAIEWTDYVPAYSVRDAILSDIRKNPSPVRKVVQSVNLALSFLPWGVRYRLARLWPDRFALIAVMKAVKAASGKSVAE